MTPQQIIQAAIDRLHENDEDPRNPLMRDLQRLADAGCEVPSGEVELTTVLQPGGKFQVHDQHGRPVRGVKSVAVFQDQSGQPVFQVNL